MIDDEVVEVVLDGGVVEEGGKLIWLDVGTAGPAYKLEGGGDLQCQAVVSCMSWRAKTRLGRYQ